jgi:hypothetical protein
MPLPSKLRSAVKKMNTKQPPLWKGPQVDGITFSLLSRFLVDKERFRVLVMEGLAPNPYWDHKLGYGNMWHVCEEALASKTDPTHALEQYVKEEVKKYPTQGPAIVNWFEICKRQFPIYEKYWRKHPDVVNRIPLYQELSFATDYSLPSGRVVKLRGKFDSIDSIKIGNKRLIYLQENKSKADIAAERMRRQLKFDLQTMLYLIAMDEMRDKGELDLPDDQRISGVRYNLVRRPLGGGKFSIKQRSGRQTKNGLVGAETEREFHDRLALVMQEEADESIKEKRDCWFFMRWLVDIEPEDYARFIHQCLDPMLEDLCDWWELMTGTGDRFGAHYRMPHGIWNPLLEGRATELDEYLETGNKVGLHRIDTLFQELESA